MKHGVASQKAHWVLQPKLRCYPRRVYEAANRGEDALEDTPGGLTSRNLPYAPM